MKPTEPVPVSGMWRALGSRNYRLWFGGQFVSLVGLWMAHVAMGWLVYRLTGSKLLLGTVAFAGQIPAFVLGPLAGVMIDRWDLRRTLLITQGLAALQAAALATVVITGVVEVWQVIALAAALGVVNAFDMPARHAFVVQMVERREDLPNAIALNSSLFNASRLVGPAIAGVLVAAAGEGICFALNAVSFAAVLVALAMMRVKAARRREAQTYSARAGRGAGICVAAATDPDDPGDDRGDQPGRDSVRGADAGLCAGYSARRAADAGIFDDGHGRRRAGRRIGSGGAAIDGDAAPVVRGGGRGAGRRAGGAVDGSDRVDVAGDFAGGGICGGERRGGGQYAGANPGRGREPRAGDGAVQHGVSGNDAAGELAGGGRGRNATGGAGDGGRGRGVLYRCIGVFWHSGQKNKRSNIK